MLPTRSVPYALRGPIKWGLEISKENDALANVNEPTVIDQTTGNCAFLKTSETHSRAVFIARFDNILLKLRVGGVFQKLTWLHSFVTQS